MRKLITSLLACVLLLAVRLPAAESVLTGEKLNFHFSAGDAYVPTVSVGMYAPLGDAWWRIRHPGEPQTCQKTARLRPAICIVAREGIVPRVPVTEVPWQVFL
jgi:hypothetical protein